jgi:Ca-activated chloride channel family protein
VLARTLLIASVCFTLSGILATAGMPATNSKPQISVNVNVVTVPVTVTDAHGNFLSKLSRQDFRLFVDDTEQAIEYFSPEETPAQVLILLETGPAVYLLQGEHISAATDFLQGLGSEDRVAVASYADAPQLLLNFTTDKQQAAAALHAANYGLGLANLNFYASVTSALDWLAPQDGKRAIVVLTTGLDSSGEASWQRLTAAMQRSNVIILPVGLGGTLRDQPGKRKNPVHDSSPPTGQELSFREANRALETIAAETGGRSFFPRNARDFDAAYRRIAALLRHQYSLGFTESSSDGRYHTIRVELTGKRGREDRINYRRGYLAPAN